MPGVMSMDIASNGKLLNQDSKSIIDQSDIGVTRPSVARALVLKDEYMLTGKSLMLSCSQCLRCGRVSKSQWLDCSQMEGFQRSVRGVIWKDCALCQRVVQLYF